MTWRDLRVIILGKLGWKPEEFGEATLSELYDAVKGYAEHERDRMEMVLFGMRRVAYCVLVAAGGQRVKEKDIMHLRQDDEENKRFIEEVGFL